jgi:hypothetical protein
MKRAIRVSAALILSGALLCFWLMTTMVYRKTFVDLHTGRPRTNLDFGGMTLCAETRENDFSKSWRAFFGSYPAAKWTPESEYQWPWGKRSPDYGFLGVFRWEGWILSAFDDANFDPDVKRLIIGNFTRLLEQEDPYAAQRYALELLAYAAQNTRKSISTTNCPSWIISGKVPIENR